MSEIYVWLGGVIALIGSLAVAWLGGKSKGKAEVENKVNEQKVEQAVQAANRQTTVSKEAAHVDQTVNNASSTDVDSQLLNKWTRK